MIVPLWNILHSTIRNSDFYFEIRETRAKKSPENYYWDPNIGDISCALYTLSLSKLILNSKYEEGARDVNNNLVPRVKF